MCGHHEHGRRRWRGVRRVPTAEEFLQMLEEHQRDLEQETADVAELIRRLREDQPKETATV